MNFSETHTPLAGIEVGLSCQVWQVRWYLRRVDGAAHHRHESLSCGRLKRFQNTHALMHAGQVCAMFHWSQLPIAYIINAEY